jgi:hypothetical protein
MDEHNIYSVKLDGLFPEAEEPIRVHGTAGEVFERVAEEWGLNEEDNADLDIPLDGVYPSIRSIRAHQLLEDHIGKSGVFSDPDSLLVALVREGLVRYMTEAEYEDWIDEEEMDVYDNARAGLDDEWTDGVWET